MENGIKYWGSILGLLLITLLAIQWFCWIFGLGRFKNIEAQKDNIEYIITNFFVNLINDFRHLLALMIVFVFAITLFYVLYKTGATELGEAMQQVSSTFSGLIGAIIGFYFGEKSYRNSNKASIKQNINTEIEEQSEPDLSDSKSMEGLNVIQTPKDVTDPVKSEVK